VNDFPLLFKSLRDSSAFKLLLKPATTVDNNSMRVSACRHGHK